MARGFGVHPPREEGLLETFLLQGARLRKRATQRGSRAAQGLGPAGLGRPHGNVDRTLVPYFNTQGADTWREKQVRAAVCTGRDGRVSTVLTAGREGRKLGGPGPRWRPH